MGSSRASDESLDNGDRFKFGDTIDNDENHEDDDNQKSERGIKVEETTPILTPKLPSSQDAFALLGVSRPESSTPQTTTPSPPEKPSRVNRKEKRFVVTKQDPRALATPKGKKREADGSITPPIQPTAKRTRADQEEAKLPYQSIKAINMPPRLGLVPGQIPPVPDRANLPFGETEDFCNSLIIHWCDEQELGYGRVAGLHNQMFPQDKMTAEAVRRRHIRSLQRLTKKFGAKPLSQIGPLGKNVLQRGKSRAPRLSDIVPAVNWPSVSAQAEGTEDAAATTATPNPLQVKIGMANRFSARHDTLQAKRNPVQNSIDFKKACIVVWRDSLKMDFKTIRDKLETEYTWSLGLGTIEKYYYQNIDRVYGTLRENTRNDQDDGDDQGQKVVEAANGNEVGDFDASQVPEGDLL